MDTLTYLTARGLPLLRSGNLYRTHCPLGRHPDRDPSFVIYPDGHVHCFGCAFHASSLTELVRALEFPGLDLRDGRHSAVHLLHSLSLAPAAHTTHRPSVSPLPSLSAQDLAYLTTAAHYYAACLLRLPPAALPLAYLRRRGIHPATARKFLIGYAPPHPLHPGPRDPQRALRLGLLRQPIPGHFRHTLAGRLTLPLLNEHGQVTHIQGRWPGSCSPQRRYLGTRTPKTLYGLATLPDRTTQPVWILESWLDSLRLYQAGQLAIAMAGSAFPAAERYRLHHRSLIILPDNDPPGRRAAQTLLQTLGPYAASITIAQIPPPAKDLGDLSATQIARLVQQYVQVTACLPASAECGPPSIAD